MPSTSESPLLVNNLDYDPDSYMPSSSTTAADLRATEAMVRGDVDVDDPDGTVVLQVSSVSRTPEHDAVRTSHGLGIKPRYEADESFSSLWQSQSTMIHDEEMQLPPPFTDAPPRSAPILPGAFDAQARDTSTPFLAHTASTLSYSSDSAPKTAAVDDAPLLHDQEGEEYDEMSRKIALAKQRLAEEQEKLKSTQRLQEYHDRMRALSGPAVLPSLASQSSSMDMLSGFGNDTSTICKTLATGGEALAESSTSATSHLAFSTPSLAPLCSTSDVFNSLPSYSVREELLGSATAPAQFLHLDEQLQHERSLLASAQEEFNNLKQQHRQPESCAISSSSFSHLKPSSQTHLETIPPLPSLSSSSARAVKDSDSSQSLSIVSEMTKQSRPAPRSSALESVRRKRLQYFGRKGSSGNVSGSADAGESNYGDALSVKLSRDYTGGADIATNSASENDVYKDAWSNSSTESSATLSSSTHYKIRDLTLLPVPSTDNYSRPLTLSQENHFNKSRVENLLTATRWLDPDNVEGNAYPAHVNQTGLTRISEDLPFAKSLQAPLQTTTRFCTNCGAANGGTSSHCLCGASLIFPLPTQPSSDPSLKPEPDFVAPASLNYRAPIESWHAPDQEESTNASTIHGRSYFPNAPTMDGSPALDTRADSNFQDSEVPAEMDVNYSSALVTAHDEIVSTSAEPHLQSSSSLSSSAQLASLPPATDTTTTTTTTTTDGRELRWRSSGRIGPRNATGMPLPRSNIVSFSQKRNVDLMSSSAPKTTTVVTAPTHKTTHINYAPLNETNSSSTSLSTAPTLPRPPLAPSLNPSLMGDVRAALRGSSSRAHAHALSYLNRQTQVPVQQSSERGAGSISRKAVNASAPASSTPNPGSARLPASELRPSSRRQTRNGDDNASGGLVVTGTHVSK